MSESASADAVGLARRWLLPRSVLSGVICVIAAFAIGALLIAAIGRDPVLACNDGLGLKMAALAGAGLLLQPEILLRDELREGRLVRVLDAFLPTPRAVHILYRQDLRPLPKLTSFIDHLQREVTKI